MSEQKQPDTLAQLSQAFTQFGQALTTHVMSIWQELQPILQKMYGCMYEAYRKEGMPYGDTHEGLLQWIEDMSQRRHVQMLVEIDQDLDPQEHAKLSEARKLAEEVRMRGEESEAR